MAYVNIAKPSLGSYTNISKPSQGIVILAGMATGLICPPTYAVNIQITGNIYGNISKPAVASYTNISKPT